MRCSQLLIPARAPDDRADLLSAAGYSQRIADGVYALLPLGQRVLARISAIVRAEFDRAGAQELVLPLLQPAALWDRALPGGATRAHGFGSQLFRLAAQPGCEPWVLSPTHEEVAAVVARACIRDARDLPRTIYQVQPRFRDQDCPDGAGLLRTREFVMADAYTFATDRSSLDRSYDALKAALIRALQRCGVQPIAVHADSGGLGGDESEELIVALPHTSLAALHCAQCGYAVSSEIAQAQRTPAAEPTASRPLAELAAPDELTLAATAALLEVAVDRRLTWVPFVCGARIVLAVTTGERTINAVKLRRALATDGIDASALHPASSAELSALGATYATISLCASPPSVLVVADESVHGGRGFWLPSLRAGRFLLDAEPGRDLRIDRYADLSLVAPGEPCVRCAAPLRAIAGIEIGHVFKLGRELARAFDVCVSSPSGTREPLELGCFGLGLTRLMAVLAELGRNASGFAWPERIAPYHALLIAEDERARTASDALYEALGGDHGDVLLADGIGSTAAHATLAAKLGIPLQLRVSSHTVSIQDHAGVELERVPAGEIGAWLTARTERVL